MTIDASTVQPLWDLPTNHDRLAEHVHLKDRVIVDVGCGAGGLVRFLRAAGASPIGVECGEAMIRQAREADTEYADAYLDGVGQDLPIEDDSADVVIFSYSLHHVPVEHMTAALAEAGRVLRAGGELVVLEPIAEGPGFETHRPIDDETVVRAHAQDTLDNGRPAGLTETASYRYTTAYSYLDMAELEKVLIDIDSERRAAFESVKDEVDVLFHEHGEEHGGRYWFPQPVLMRIFTKN